MTSKQVTSPPWNSRRLVHSKEMAWASRWSVALRAFYRQILSSSNCKDFFFKWHRPPRKLAKEVFVKFIPAKEKTRFAKEWRKVLAKDHVIRIDSHEVFNTAQVVVSNMFIFTITWGRFAIWLIFFRWVETTNQFMSLLVNKCPQKYSQTPSLPGTWWPTIYRWLSSVNGMMNQIFTWKKCNRKSPKASIH